MVDTPIDTGLGWKIFRTIADVGSADATDFVGDQDFAALATAGIKGLRFQRQGDGIVSGVQFALVLLDSDEAIVDPGSGTYSLQVIEVVRRRNAPHVPHLLARATNTSIAVNAVTTFTGVAGPAEIGVAFTAPSSMPGGVDVGHLLYREI